MSETTSRVDRLLRPQLRELSVYHVPSSAGLIKLDAMENPYALPVHLQDEWLQVLRGANLNRYPDASADVLKQDISNVLQLPSQCELLLGNGSDELIQLLCLVVLDSPQRKTGKAIVMAPEPGFVMYRHTAIATGLDYVGVPLQPDTFALNLPAMLHALDKYQPEIVFLAYPNNPTGNLFDRADCQRIIQQAPGLVVIDEAYHPFAEASIADALTKYDNVLLLRTFSKLGLAGIRLGVLAGAPVWLSHVDKLRLPYNINVLTQLTARFACQHHELFLQQAALVRRQRKRLLYELNALPKLHVYDSRANFILFRVGDQQAADIHKKLIEQGVLIKNLDKTHPMLNDCLRVTVGTEDENGAFLQALKQSLVD